MQLVDAPIWHCVANYITCRHGHPLRFHEAGYASDQRRLDGHVFYGCKSCSPTSFFFGVVTSRPSPMVTCYAITREQYQEWNASMEDALASPDMLYRLGYNPSYQPSRQ